MKKALWILGMVVWAGLALAVEPSEVLSDPVLEDRARSISQGLRCLQCRNESIDESNAGIAKDLRILVRRRLVEGDSDTEIMDYIVARYGEYVLLRPNGLGINLVLWMAGPLLFLIALAFLLSVQRRSKRSILARDLTKEEESEINNILSSGS
jgi:cytochrome c-type biogenesis protein CcmH